MRTQEQIAARIREVREADRFGFQFGVLVEYLNFEHAREFLKPEVTAEEWDDVPPTRETVLAEMAGYMDFAWNKALGHRSPSAGRSVTEIQAWLWLLEDTETLAFAEADENYPQYGVPVLKHVCERYGLPTPGDTAVERMALGQPCRPGCDEGCRPMPRLIPEEIIEIERYAGDRAEHPYKDIPQECYQAHVGALLRHVREQASELEQARAEEREACAKIADYHGSGWLGDGTRTLREQCEVIANSIRARGNNGNE